MTIDVRRISPDELEGWLDTLSTAFLDRPDTVALSRELPPLWDFERIWAAFDGRVVGTLRTWATEITVPGGARVAAAAMAAVTVLRTHRRRGVLRSMIAAEHDAARVRGEVIAILYASETSIYGRFGYGTAIQTGTLVVDARSTSMHRGSAERVTFASIDASTADLCRGLFDRFRHDGVGQIRRRDFTFADGLGLRETAWGPKWKGWLAVHRDAAGEPDGYVRYSAEEKWEERQPRWALDVQDFVALNDDAYDDLWRFLLETDLVAKVRAERRSPDERLPWLLTNQRAAAFAEAGDGLWVALLDVRAALAARSYERAGDIVLEVIDAEPGTGRTRIRLEAGPDGAACSMTTRDPDLTLHADALGAAYLGGTPLRHAVLARGHVEHRAGALSEADALFRTLDRPTCITFF